MFMSRNVLKEETPHSAMDDIESFYYVLLYSCLVFTGPGSELDDFPSPIYGWTGISAASSKGGFLQIQCDVEVQPWWGIPFQSLIGRMHAQFSELCDQEFLANFDKRATPKVDVGHIYDLFLQYIEVALEALAQNPEDEQPLVLSHTLTRQETSHSPPPWIPCRTTLAGERKMRK